MPPATANLSFAVKGLYDTFIGKIEDSANNSNGGIVKYSQPLSGSFRNVPGGKAEFESYIHLKGWRVRSTSNKRMSVLIHVQETIQCSDQSLVRSTVRVSYFDIDGDNATLLQSIHFDYGALQDCHPTFHAQVTNEPITLTEDQALELDFVYAVSDGNQSWFNNAHIPTSDMTFASVLLCLAADHIPVNFFRPVLEFFRSSCEAFPKPTFTALRTSLADHPNHLRSLHWFSHM